MKRKRLLAGFALMFALGISAGCSKDPGGQKEQAKTEKTDPVTLVVFLQAAVSDEDFKLLFSDPVKKKYPYITLQMIRAGTGTGRSQEERKKMSKQHYGFAIIGAGVIGRSHAQYLQRVEKGKLVVICDKNEENGRKLAGECGCDWSGDIHAVLSRSDVDIVTICLPSGMHAEIYDLRRSGRQTCDYGKTDRYRCRERTQEIEACRKAGVKLAVISQHRLQPSTQQIKKDMESGLFGTMIIGNAAVNWYRSQEYYDSGAWRGTWAFDGGGALMNQGIHTVDVLQYLMGPVESVFAHCETLGHERIEVEDVAVATLRFRSGAVGTLVATTCAYPGLTTRIEIFGKDGSAVIEGDDLVFRETGDDNPAFKRIQDTTTAGDPTAINGEGHILQINDMIAAIEQNREPVINGEEGYKPLEIILAVYESARKGCIVTLANSE